MKPAPENSRWANWLSGGCLALAVVAVGCLAGAFVATRVLTTSQMGWDQLGDLLGGFAVGTVLGLAASAFLIMTLGTRKRIIATLVALGVLVALVLALRATAPRTQRASVAPEGSSGGSDSGLPAKLGFRDGTSAGLAPLSSDRRRTPPWPST